MGVKMASTTFPVSRRCFGGIVGAAVGDVVIDGAQN
jgi:hypothetical protein